MHPVDLTGAPAFAGESAADIMASVLAREPEWTRLPPDLAEAFTRALETTGDFGRICLHVHDTSSTNDLVAR